MTRLSGAFEVDIGNGHIRTAPGKLQRYSAPDPFGRPIDERGLVVKKRLMTAGHTPGLLRNHGRTWKLFYSD